MLALTLGRNRDRSGHVDSSCRPTLTIGEGSPATMDNGARLSSSAPPRGERHTTSLSRRPRFSTRRCVARCPDVESVSGRCRRGALMPAPTPPSTPIDWIRRYLATGSHHLAQLREQMGTTQPCRHPWDRDNWPRSGVTPDDVYYSFHGVGCGFFGPGEELIVDIDFDDDFGCTQFDAWRLAEFQRARTGECAATRNDDLASWRLALADLERQGSVVSAGREGRFRLVSA